MNKKLKYVLISLYLSLLLLMATVPIALASPDEITWGDDYESEVLPDGGQPQVATSCYLGNNKFVIAYVYTNTDDPPENRDGRALVGTISGTTITYGSEHVFYDICNKNAAVNLCRLEDDKFVVVYGKQVGGAYEYLYAKVGTVTGETITYGTEAQLTSSQSWTNSACTINSSKFAVAYNDTGASPDNGKVVVCTVSGTTITGGTPQSFLANQCNETELCLVDTDKLLLVYKDAMAAGARAIVDTVTDTTNSFGTPVVLDATAAQWFSMSLAETNKVVLAWNSDTVYVDRYGSVGIVTVSGTSCSIGDIEVFQDPAAAGQGPGNIKVLAIDAAHFALVYTDDEHLDNPGVYRYGTFSGSTISSLGTETEWYSDDGYTKGLFLVDPYKILLVFYEGLSGPSLARIGYALVSTPIWLSATPISSTQIYLEWLKGAEHTGVYYKLGNYPEDRDDGTLVYLGPLEDYVHNGLTPGTTYYYRAWGYDPDSETWAEDYAEDYATTLLGKDPGLDVPIVPSEWWQTPACTAYENLPIWSNIEDLAYSYAVPLNNFCLFITLLGIVTLSLGSWFISRTSLIVLMMAFVLIIVTSIAGLLPMWMLAFDIVLGGLLIYIWIRG